MRTYTGKYPHSVKSIWDERGKEGELRRYYVRTNNGRTYRVHVCSGGLPAIGSDINAWGAFELVAESDLQRFEHGMGLAPIISDDDHA